MRRQDLKSKETIITMEIQIPSWIFHDSNLQHDALLNPRLLYCFQLDVPPPFLPSFMKLGSWSRFRQLKVVSCPIHCKKTLFNIYQLGLGRISVFYSKNISLLWICCTAFLNWWMRWKHKRKRKSRVVFLHWLLN